MYCNLFFTRLWRHKFRNWFNLSNQAVFSTCPKSRDKNLNILRTKSFLDEIKSIFHHFWRTIIEANNIFLGRWESDAKSYFLRMENLFPRNKCQNTAVKKNFGLQIQYSISENCFCDMCPSETFFKEAAQAFNPSFQ